ncbi:hypothetical protein ACFQ36_10825 [Arthrobacter sp. GCM10027362]|uniref:hypothetical protein n=1 Tax=Arthrobacter sp. GCM10027362 TaxID=3273379 RepID=UPI00363C0583
MAGAPLDPPQEHEGSADRARPVSAGRRIPVPVSVGADVLPVDPDPDWALLEEVPDHELFAGLEWDPEIREYVDPDGDGADPEGPGNGWPGLPPAVGAGPAAGEDQDGPRSAAPHEALPGAGLALPAPVGSLLTSLAGPIPEMLTYEEAACQLGVLRQLEGYLYGRLMRLLNRLVTQAEAEQPFGRPEPLGPDRPDPALATASAVSEAACALRIPERTAAALVKTPDGWRMCSPVPWPRSKPEP